jgi:integrase/recombinase XerD
MSFKNYLQRKRASPKSIESHQSNIKLFEAWLDYEGLSLEVIHQKDILSYLQSRKEKGNSNCTLSHHLNSIRKYFTAHQIQPNPCDHLKITGITKHLPTNLLTKEELEKLYIKYPEKTIQEQRDKVMVGLLIYQGITTAELKNLATYDYSEILLTIEIRKSLKGEYRRLKLRTHQNESIANYLKDIRPKLENQSGLITDQLIINGGKSERKEKLKNTIAELVQRLKRNNDYFRSARQLRGSRIALWLTEYNLREVQQMAGHRYVSSTERYQMGKVEDLQRELDKYHPRK